MHKSDFDVCTGLLIEAIRTARTGYGAVTDAVSSLFSDVDNAEDLASILQSVSNSEYAPDDCKDNKPRQTEWSTFRKTVQRVAEGQPDLPYVVQFGTKKGSRYVSVTAVTREWLANQETRKAEDTKRAEARKAEDKAMREQVARAERDKMTTADIANDALEYIASKYGDDRVIPAVSEMVDMLQDWAIRRDKAEKAA